MGEDRSPTWASWRRASGSEKFREYLPAEAPFHLALKVVQSHYNEAYVREVITSWFGSGGPSETNIIELADYQRRQGFELGAQLAADRLGRLRKRKERSGPEATREKREAQYDADIKQAIALAEQVWLLRPAPPHWKLDGLASKVLEGWPRDEPRYGKHPSNVHTIEKYLRPWYAAKRSKKDS
ncbi:MAG: hypothetical protein JWO33_1002 [Caulobacteraceae bacterium]|nr:hypothetical protein [Caulobacteraceae bacterium]